MRQLLRDLDAGDGELSRWCTLDPDPVRVLSVFTRIATCAASIIGDPAFELERRTFDALVPLIGVLSQVFAASGLGSLEPLLAGIERRSGKRENDQLVFTSLSDARKFILGGSIYAFHGARIARMARRDPKAMHGALLSALAPEAAADPRALAARHDLLRATSHLADVTPSPASIGPLTHAWALSSYATTVDRHRAKAHLNRMIRNWINAEGIRAPDIEARPPSKDDPVMLVACEIGKQEHVMHRCYALYLRQLSSRFRVVALMSRDHAESGEPDWADQTITFDTGQLQIAEIVQRISAIGPDVIYYPSLGMRLWAIILCNLRLAPLQFATLGHPATTHSPEIDCMLMGRHMLGSPDCFSEPAVLLECPGNLFAPRERDIRITPDVRNRPDPVRVAFNANPMKLNADFIGACQRVAERSARRLEFHVFPNAVGIRYVMTRVQIERMLGASRVQVYPRADVDTYLKNLGRCDVCFSPFPFGGENSTLDALELGIPVVTLKGLEPHARLDTRVLNLVGAPDWLATRSVDDYERAALRLVEDDTARREVAESLIATDVLQIALREHESYPTDFVDTVTWMYENRQRIRDRERDVWTPEIRLGRSSAPPRFAGKRIIAFSLWGDVPLYTRGAEENARLAAEIYPGWTCRYYVDRTVPESTITALKAHDHVEVIRMETEVNAQAPFWRFRPADEPDVEVTICRDVDSRLNWREQAAVQQWLDGDRGFHLMRDHPRHETPMLAGLWGVKRGRLPDIALQIEQYLDQRGQTGFVYGVDQQFLMEVVYPVAVRDCLVHDEIFQNKPFPTPRRNWQYVGQIIEADGSTRTAVDDLLKRHVEERS
ncbi:MAG: hypothetical protein CMJ18_19100 [Phycisphaeraceae bacterium]|nr:hypothetical protein [Phycisphaeraceae bacterium]